MKFLKYATTLFLTLIFLASCGDKNLSITDYGPPAIKAGIDFNLQANGDSAIWMKTKNETPSTIILFDEIQLKSASSIGGVTAVVPKNLYSEPGEHDLYLYDLKTGKKSKSVKFLIK